MLADSAARGLRPVAVDLSGSRPFVQGSLTLETGTVPALAAWVERFAGALGITGPVKLAGHDIGGGIAQHLLVKGTIDRTACAGQCGDVRLMAGARRGSLPRSGGRCGNFARRYPERARQAIRKGLLESAASEALVEEYRSVDGRTCDTLVDGACRRGGRPANSGSRVRVRASAALKLLVWGEEDPYQRVEYAERFAARC